MNKMLTVTGLRILCVLLVLFSLSFTASLCNTELNGFPFPYDGPTADTNDSASCPPWKYQKTPNSTCECGSSIGQVVQCMNRSVYMFTCHCMTDSEDLGTVIMGSCPFLCENVYYIQIDRNLDRICNQINRTGQLCGRCLEGYAPAVYSYGSQCVKCTHYKHNWIKYLVIAYLPVTLFYVFVVLFRFNAMSPSMIACIFVCQIISSPAIAGIFTTYVYFSEKQPVVHINIRLIGDFMSSLYGIWNLDFFRYVYKPFCLHPNMSILQMISLDYAIAVYPLLLIFLTYTLVSIYDRFSVVQLLWKPITWIMVKINREFGVKRTLIKAFGTFILLSYVKVLNTSVDILMPVQVYNASGIVVGVYTYYNGSLEYFGREHLPYAFLAIFMFATLNLAPFLLLCLYPCRCFQSCLNCCRLNSQVLRTFMDAFQGCYKFEPYDCRYFSGFYFFLRVAILAIFLFTESTYVIIISGMAIMIVIVFFLIVKPYTQSIYITIDTILLMSFVLLCFGASAISLSNFNHKYRLFSFVMLGIGLLYPALYASVLGIYSIMPKSVKVHVKRYFKKFTSVNHGRGDEANEDALLEVGEENDDDFLLDMN